jgi:hypothetical protein
MATDSELTLPATDNIVGYVDPLIGRIARRDVSGYFGFPLIKAGQAVTHATIEKAQQLGRLFELVAATDDV